MMLLIKLSICVSYRCSHHNEDLSRRGALRLLTLILELHSEQQQALAVAQAAEVGGFMPSAETTSVSGGSGAEKDCGSCVVSARSAVNLAGTSKELSPRKDRRRKSLKANFHRGSLKHDTCLVFHQLTYGTAKYLADRAHQMAIQVNWAESVPSFYQESDM